MKPTETVKEFFEIISQNVQKGISIIPASREIIHPVNANRVKMGLILGLLTFASLMDLNCAIENGDVDQRGFKTEFKENGMKERNSQLDRVFFTIDGEAVTMEQIMRRGPGAYYETKEGAAEAKIQEEEAIKQDAGNNIPEEAVITDLSKVIDPLMEPQKNDNNLFPEESGDKEKIELFIPKTKLQALNFYRKEIQYLYESECRKDPLLAIEGGKITLKIVFDIDGSVSDCKVIENNLSKEFGDKAVNKCKHWIFPPSKEAEELNAPFIFIKKNSY